jgi:hypothetical protein
MAASAGPRDRATDRPARQAAGPGAAFGPARDFGPAEARDQLLGPLAEAMAEARDRVMVCTTCGSLDTTNPCAICADHSRDGGLICVVEEVGSVWAMERASAFKRPLPRARRPALGPRRAGARGPARAGADPAGGPRRCGARGDPRPAGHRRRPDHRPLPRRTPRLGQCDGDHAGPRRAGRRRPRLARRRHHRPGATGPAAGRPQGFGLCKRDRIQDGGRRPRDRSPPPRPYRPSLAGHPAGRFGDDRLGGVARRRPASRRDHGEDGRGQHLAVCRLHLFQRQSGRDAAGRPDGGQQRCWSRSYRDGRDLLRGQADGVPPGADRGHDRGPRVEDPDLDDRRPRPDREPDPRFHVDEPRDRAARPVRPVPGRAARHLRADLLLLGAGSMLAARRPPGQPPSPNS